MTKLARFALAGLAFAGILCGCSLETPDAGPPDTAPAPSAAAVLLKKSMDLYASMPSFSAVCRVTFPAATGPIYETEANPDQSNREQVRKLNFQKPNRFRVVSSSPSGFEITTISNGTSVLEYDNFSSTMPITDSAPATIATADSAHMRNPRASGSPLYAFFGGSSRYGELVEDTIGDVSFGNEERVNGESAHVVNFRAHANFGHVQALIGETTGLVYRIQYDGGLPSDELTEHVPGKARLLTVAASSRNTPRWTEETYSNMRHPASLSPTAFRLDPPKGTIPFDVRVLGKKIPRAPVEDGTPAPDITVERLDGTKVRLSSLKGHPVLIYFWIPWNATSTAGLANIDEYAAEGLSQGLKVMVVSGENNREVYAHIKENRYTFPAYIDAYHEAREEYNLVTFPTTVVLDASGNLVEYITGGMKSLAIRDALERVGINLG